MRVKQVGWIAMLVCVCAASAASSADLRPIGSVTTVSGGPFKARLQAISADGMVSWELPNSEVRKIPLVDLCWWGDWAEARPQTQLVLVDGSLIVADVIG